MLSRVFFRFSRHSRHDALCPARATRAGKITTALRSKSDERWRANSVLRELSNDLSGRIKIEFQMETEPIFLRLIFKIR